MSFRKRLEGMKVLNWAIPIIAEADPNDKTLEPYLHEWILLSRMAGQLLEKIGLSEESKLMKEWSKKAFLVCIYNPKKSTENLLYCLAAKETLPRWFNDLDIGNEGFHQNCYARVFEDKAINEVMTSNPRSTSQLCIQLITAWAIDAAEVGIEEFRSFTEILKQCTEQLKTNFKKIQMMNASNDTASGYRQNEFWQFSFLVTHMELCTSNYGIAAKPFFEFNNDIKEILNFFQNIPEFLTVPDLLGEIAFCYHRQGTLKYKVDEIFNGLLATVRERRVAVCQGIEESRRLFHSLFTLILGVCCCLDEYASKK